MEYFLLDVGRVLGFIVAAESYQGEGWTNAIVGGVFLLLFFTCNDEYQKRKLRR